jgi:hypothetical protein
MCAGHDGGAGDATEVSDRQLRHLGLSRGAGADAVKRSYRERRAELHRSPKGDERCRRLRHARTQATIAVPSSAWPRRPTVYDLLGLKLEADPSLLRPAMNGRINDLHESQPPVTRDQISWCMTRCGFNAAWTSRRGGINRDYVLSRMSMYGIRPGKGAALQSVAVLWAFLLLNDDRKRDEYLRTLTREHSAADATNSGSRLVTPDASGTAGTSGTFDTPTAVARSSSASRELLGGIEWRNTRPESWRDTMLTPTAPAPAPPTPPAAVHPALTPQALTARQHLSLSLVASPGVVEEVGVSLLRPLHARLSRAASDAGRVIADDCEKLETAYLGVMAAYGES